MFAWEPYAASPPTTTSFAQYGGTNEGVPPFTRGVMGHEIGLALARELRPLVPGHSLPLSSPQRIQWHVCGGRRGQDGCDRAEAV